MITGDQQTLSIFRKHTMADDKIREGDPDKPRKKKPQPAAAEEERPRKKRPADDDDEDDAPKRKKVKKDEDESDMGSSPISALIPVGGSIFALLSLWLSAISLLAGIAAMILSSSPIVPAIAPGLWPLALLSGIASFFTHKSKASYGSITGNMRAILGILISLVVMVMHGFFVFLYFKGAR
jgi:hypothetical protein